MSNEQVSIIIPTYYRNGGLVDAIESSLDQSHKNTEIIVVDDSGEEHAKSTAEQYNVQYISHSRNQGGNPARNTGYEVSNGDFVQLLDDDDTIHPEKLSKQLELLKNHSTLGVAYGGIVDKEGNEVLPSENKSGSAIELALQLFWPTTITSSLLISEKVFSEVHPLTDRPAADDIGMKIELAKRTEFGFVDEVLTYIGDSINSRSSNIEYLSEVENIYNEYIREYENVQDQVQNTALSNVYRAKGKKKLKENYWSLSAIKLYFLSAKLSSAGVVPFLGFFASCFGRPGVKIANWVHNEMRIFK